jgi:hypothetical protein
VESLVQKYKVPAAKEDVAKQITSQDEIKQDFKDLETVVIKSKIKNIDAIIKPSNDPNSKPVENQQDVAKIKEEEVKKPDKYE